MTAENREYEQSLADLKRDKLSASLRGQFEALRELGEKLAMVGKWGEVLANEMGQADGQMGMDELGTRVKAALEDELGTWTKGDVPSLGGAAASRDDASSVLTRSDARCVLESLSAHFLGADVDAIAGALATRTPPNSRPSLPQTPLPTSLLTLRRLTPQPSPLAPRRPRPSPRPTPPQSLTRPSLALLPPGAVWRTLRLSRRYTQKRSWRLCPPRLSHLLSPRATLPPLLLLLLRRRPPPP